MRQRLENLIKRIILPKYPFIVNYEVMRNLRHDRLFYSVNLFIDKNMTPEAEDFPSNKISKDVRNLFLALGPGHGEIFDGTKFLYKH